MNPWFALLLPGTLLAQENSDQHGTGPGQPLVAQVRSVGLATAGAQGLPSLSLLGAPILGHPFALQVENGPPSGSGFLLLGFELAPLPLRQFAAVLQPGVPLEVDVFGLDANGASEELRMLNEVSLSLLGRTFVAQAALVDENGKGGLAFTKGIGGRFGPTGSMDLYAPRTTRGDVIDLEAGDWDGDGLVDMIALEPETFGSGRIRPHVGHGDGTFTPGAPYMAGPGVQRLAVGDLDGDGALDVLVANDDPPVNPYTALTAFLGDGDGSFPIVRETPLALRPNDVVLGDLDRDGTLDAVSTDWVNGKVLSLRGLGDGTFEAPVLASSDSLYEVLADFDMDGLLDLAVTTQYSDVVRVFRGSGTMAFGAPDTYDVDLDGASIACADLGGDGRLDLVAAGGDDVALLEGRGDGSFEPPTSLGLEQVYLALAVGDLDADGDPDLVAPYRGGAASVLLGGAPTLQLAADIPALAEPWAAVSADFDQDGLDDVAIGSLRDGLSVLLSAGAGAFEAPSFVELSSGGRDALLDDFDRDQDLDLVVLESGVVRLYEGSGSAGFEPGEPILSYSGGRSLFASDLDGNQTLDLVVQGSSDIQVALEEDGSYQPAANLTGLRPTAVAAGDLDQDGIADLVVPADIAFGGEVHLFHGAGDGTFTPLALFTGLGRTDSVVISDLNRDGLADFVVGAEFDVWLFFSRGAGAFDPPLALDVSGDNRQVVLHDVQPDGWPDILVARGPDVCVLPGLGGGAFGSCLSTAAGAGVISLAVADVDRDREADLVVGNTDWGNFSLLRGLGDGTFQHVDDYLVGGLPVSTIVRDIDDDLMPDVLVTSGPRVVLFPNRVLRP